MFGVDDLETLLDDNGIDLDAALEPQSTLMELGIDSFNMTVLADTLSELAGADLDLLPTHTVQELLDRINHEP
jgi:aryl carrier-like protein